ncbi:MAG: hypothetical protein PHC86_05655 [Eubacteriales bacterium]|nr:hypothetical protein [Eubacteriales bacterium]
MMVAVLVTVLSLAGYSYFFRHFLDADRYLELALEATGNDPSIINADEPDFAIRFENRRLTIHFVFQTEAQDGIGSINLDVDPFRKTYFNVEKSEHYLGLE